MSVQLQLRLQIFNHITITELCAINILHLLLCLLLIPAP